MWQHHYLHWRLAKARISPSSVRIFRKESFSNERLKTSWCCMVNEVCRVTRDNLVDRNEHPKRRLGYSSVSLRNVIRNVMVQTMELLQVGHRGPKGSWKRESISERRCRRKGQVSGAYPCNLHMKKRSAWLWDKWRKEWGGGIAKDRIWRNE